MKFYNFTRNQSRRKWMIDALQNFWSRILSAHQRHLQRKEKNYLEMHYGN